MKRVWMLMNNLKIIMILKEILGVQLVLPMVLHIMKFELEQELEVYYVQDIGGGENVGVRMLGVRMLVVLVVLVVLL